MQPIKIQINDLIAWNHSITVGQQIQWFTFSIMFHYSIRTSMIRRWNQTSTHGIIIHNIHDLNLEYHFRSLLHLIHAVWGIWVINLEMAWLRGKVALPDLAGAVNKISESVKNIEKNFDNALGLELDQPAAASDSTIDGSYVLDANVLV